MTAYSPIVMEIAVHLYLYMVVNCLSKGGSQCTEHMVAELNVSMVMFISRQETWPYASTTPLPGRSGN